MNNKYPSRAELHSRSKKNKSTDKKHFYKKWWFWLIIVIIVIALIFGSLFVSFDTEKPAKNSTSTAQNASTEKIIKNDNSREKSSGITMSQYNGIYLDANGGLSQETLKSLFGQPSSTSTNAVQGVQTDADTWNEVADSELGASVVVNFSNNHAISKAISGLKVDRKDKITLEQFNQISNGTSEDDIISILGKPNGYSEVNLAGTNSKDYSYTSDVNGDVGANAIITFSNGVVSGKSQSGLK